MLRVVEDCLTGNEVMVDVMLVGGEELCNSE